MLAEAVQSVLSQTYENIELIVADDGSAQRPLDGIIGSDARLKYLPGPPRGAAAARNRGIRASTGEYVAFLDSDDLWNRKKLEHQLAAMIENPQAGLCYTDEIWLKDGKWLNQKKRHKKWGGWIFPFCLPLCIVSLSSAFFPKHVLDEIGPLNEGLPVCEDYEYWVRLSLRYQTVFLPQRLVTKRGGHEGQLSEKYWGIDRFRIKALVGILQHETLSPVQKEITANEIERKCHVVAGGARKRGFAERTDHYCRVALWARGFAYQTSDETAGISPILESPVRFPNFPYERRMADELGWKDG